MKLKKGDIVLAEFPFTDLSQKKLRPALVLWASLTIDEITICFISSQNVTSLSLDEFALNASDSEFYSTGLRVSSKVRVTRIETLGTHQTIRQILPVHFLRVLSPLSLYVDLLVVRQNHQT